jgi:uncharacterized protein YcgL (UPF0745 family)
MISCDVYKSNRRSLMYLYVSADSGLSRVPEALLRTFGEPKFVLNIELTPERALAKEDPQLVMDNLASQGYHLQMPPIEAL